MKAYSELERADHPEFRAVAGAPRDHPRAQPVVALERRTHEPGGAPSDLVSVHRGADLPRAEHTRQGERVHEAVARHRPAGREEAPGEAQRTPALAVEIDEHAEGDAPLTSRRAEHAVHDRRHAPRAVRSELVARAEAIILHVGHADVERGEHEAVRKRVGHVYETVPADGGPELDLRLCLRRTRGAGEPDSRGEKRGQLTPHGPSLLHPNRRSTPQGSPPTRCRPEAAPLSSATTARRVARGPP